MFYLIQDNKIIISISNQISRIIEIVHSLFLYRVFEIQCAFYTYSTTQFGLATFLSSYMWLVATTLNSSGT